MNVLILEREQTTRDTLEEVLTRRGHRVELSGDEAELLAAARRIPFDIIIISLDQPADESVTTLSELVDEARSDAPLIIGVVQEATAAALDARVLSLVNQVLVRPLDADLLDLQFEIFERQRWAGAPGGYRLEMPRVSREALRALIDHGLELGIILDHVGRVQFACAGVVEVHGRPLEAFQGRSFLSMVHPDDRGTVNRIIMQADEEATARVRLLGVGETSVAFDAAIHRLDAPGSPPAFALTGRRIRSAANGEQFVNQANTLMRYGGELSAIIDPATYVTFYTPGFQSIINPQRSPAPIRFIERIHPDDREAFLARVDELLSTPGSQRRIELRMQDGDGRWRAIEMVCTNLTDVPGVQGIFINAHDFTERKSLEQALARRAFLDPLTNLPNRAYFLNRLERALKRAQGNDTRIAVLFLDLDRFKLINDSLGHEIGDQLLIAVAQRLKAAVRPADMVARFGGDELIILLDDISGVEEATKVAERVIEDIGTPMRLERHEVSIATSVGIALNHPDSSDANDLIRNADIALYRAKESGSGRYVVFDESMARRVVERLEMESALRQAFDQCQFHIEFLPELSLTDGRLSALEVLLRWNHPARGPISTDDFMAVAYETGLIVNLGRWTFAEACAHARRWRLRHQAAQDLTLAFNISVREFQQPDLVEFIASTLEYYSIPPEMVRIEIDESTMATGFEDTMQKVRALHELGVTLAIDNFGTGFSSLSYLTKFTFDILKIDRQFISGEGELATNFSIVRAITSLAHALGMQVSAEGIETRAQLMNARAAGCDFGQGFLFSKSLDAASIEAIFLSAGARNAA